MLNNFTSHYCLNKPNSPLELGEEALCLATNKFWMAGTGRISLRFLPRPSLDIVINLDTMNFPITEHESNHIGFPDRGIIVPGFGSSFNPWINSTDSGSTLTWTISPPRLTISGSDKTEVDRVVFHLVNFVDFTSNLSTVEIIDETHHSINHLILEWNDYVVHLRSLPSTPDTIKTLRAEGGYAITHLGEITHKKQQIVGSEVTNLLKGLQLFFSFVRGAWSSPILPVGYDKNGDRVWESWNTPDGESYLYNYSWFPKILGTQLEQLLPGFMNLWSDPGWQDAVNEAIYWYLNSNYSPRGIDAGIILTQTAIERLCFAHSFENGKFISLDGFNKLAAADRFRLLFASLNIPQEIPALLTETTKLAKEHTWVDAPQALTEMRNEKVHPQHKKRGKFDAAIYEAWTFGLWYVEMVLLRLCGYSGLYVNRLASTRGVGEVEKVPWAS